MAKLTSMPQEEIIMGMKGTLDYYWWKDVPVVRKWPRPPSGPRSPAVQAQWPDFAQASRDWRDLEPETVAGTTHMAAYSQQRNVDMWLGLAYGSKITFLGDTFKLAPPEEKVMYVPLLLINNEGSVTLQVNSSTGRSIGGIAPLIPWSLYTYNRARLYGFGQAVGAGQTITMRLIRNFTYSQPLLPAANDIVMTTAFAGFDTGPVTIASIPASSEQISLGMKGSGASTDFLYTFIAAEFWQE